MTPNLKPAAELFGTWFTDLEKGEPPIRYKLLEPFTALDIRPGRLLLFGGAPGAGKTAALLQIAVDLLRLNEGVRVLVANVEMAPALLADRIAARLSGVPLTTIMNRELAPEQLDRVRLAMGTLTSMLPRLSFLEAPYTLEHLFAAATEHQANVVILDYIQRFSLGDGKAEKRQQLEDAAAALRRVCDMGAAVLCAAAVARQRGLTGSNYKGLNLASFRGSSELEYGCDGAYLFAPDESGLVTMKCEKNRYGAVEDIVTAFNPVTQTFTAAPAGLESFDHATPAAPRGKQAKGGPR